MTPPAAASAVPRAHRAPAAPARPRVAPRAPRRVSGPLQRPPRPARAERGLALGLADALSSLPRHRALDRLIRGRVWIALIAFALIGIVTLQLLVLTLNAHIGRALERAALLQSENTALSIESSELAGGERIESEATRLGMELVPMNALRFLNVDPRADIVRAAAALNTPVHAAGAGSGETSTGSPPQTGSMASAGSAGETGAQAPAQASGGPSGEASVTTRASGATAGAQVENAGASTPSQPQTSGSTATAPQAPEATASVPASSGAGGGTAEAAPAGAAAGAAGGTQPNGAG